MKELAEDIATDNSLGSILVDDFFSKLVRSKKSEGENSGGLYMIK